MTVANTHNRMALYACNGSTKTFDFTFEILDDEHITVILIDDNLNEFVQTLNSDYTVSGVGNPSGGAVTFGSAPSSDYKLLLLRDTPIKQDVDYVTNDHFRAETHENAIDKLTLISQDLQEEINRSIKVKKSSILSDLELPSGSAQASRVIGWDSSGTQLETYATNLASRTDIASLSGDYSSSLSTMVSTIGAAQKTVLVDIASSVDDNLTIPGNIKLIWLEGCEATIASGKTLTIYSPENIMASPRSQLFAGDGSVAFTKTGIGSAEWFATLEKAQESDMGHWLIHSDAWSISTPVDFDQNDSVIEFVGGGKISTTDNTKHGITISGNKCKVIRPLMEGPGTYVTDGTTEAALIYITGAECEVVGGKLINPPSHGIYGVGADGANIHRNFFISSLSAQPPGDTYHMAVKLQASDDVKVHHNKIDGDSTAPYGFIEGIKISSGGGIPSRPTVAFNNIKDCFDHAIYGGGVWEDFSFNQIYHTMADAGTAIVGQNARGTYYGNHIYTEVAGGMSFRDPEGSEIIGNILRLNISAATGFDGINLQPLTDGSCVYNDISGNKIFFESNGGGEGISVAASGAGNVCSYNIANRNTIKSACPAGGVAAIRFYSPDAGTTNGVGNSAQGNTIQGSSASGLYMNNMESCIGSGNIFINITDAVIELIDVSKSMFAFNTSVGDATDGIKESDSASTSRDNRFFMNDFPDQTSDSHAYNMASDQFSAIPAVQGQNLTLSGATNFTVLDGYTFIIDPNIGGAGFRNFTPLGEFPIGCIVTVRCESGSAGEGVEFNGAGASYQIDDGETGRFLWDGTTWHIIEIS